MGLPAEDIPTKPCATCEAEKPITAFIGKQRSCRDCATKKRREKAAEKPGAVEKRVSKPRIEYDPRLAEAVCDLLAEGSTLSDIALMDGYPAVRDVARWRKEVDEFDVAYRLAMDTRADVRVDGIARNVRDMRAGTLDANIGKAVNADLRWLAGKDSPRYADKISVDQTIRPGAPEPEAEQVTKAWIARVVAGSSNVIELKPEPDKDKAA